MSKNGDRAEKELGGANVGGLDKQSDYVTQDMGDLFCFPATQSAWI